MKVGDVYKVVIPLTIRAFAPFEGSLPNRTHISIGTPVILVKCYGKLGSFDFSNLWAVRALNGDEAKAYAEYLTPATPLEALAFAGDDYE
jgi:hypothetical protein